MERSKSIPRIPTPQRISRWKHESTATLLLLIAAGLSFVSACGAFFLNGTSLRIWTICFSVPVCILGVLALVTRLFKQRGQEETQRKPSRELVAVLTVLHQILMEKKRPGRKDAFRLRITLYAPEPDHDPVCFQQCVRYIGGNQSGELGRVRIGAGLVGEAFKERGPRLFNRTGGLSADLFLKQMEAYNFTREEALKLRPDRQSAFAVPVFGIDDEHVIGVMYLDSDERRFFTKEIQDLIIYAAAGLIRVLKEVEA